MMTSRHQSAAWPAARLKEARAVIADVARHSDHLIRLACNVLAAHGATEAERKDARVLLVVILCDGRVLFLELKAPKGRLRPDQEAFRDAVLAQGFGWALVRSLDDALGALVDHGLATRIAAPVRRSAP